MRHLLGVLLSFAFISPAVQARTKGLDERFVFIEIDRIKLISPLLSELKDCVENSDNHKSVELCGLEHQKKSIEKLVDYVVGSSQGKMKGYRPTSVYTLRFSVSKAESKGFEFAKKLVLEDIERYSSMQDGRLAKFNQLALCFRAVGEESERDLCQLEFEKSLQSAGQRVVSGR